MHFGGYLIQNAESGFAQELGGNWRIGQNFLPEAFHLMQISWTLRRRAKGRQ